MTYTLCSECGDHTPKMTFKKGKWYCENHGEGEMIPKGPSFLGLPSKAYLNQGAKIGGVALKDGIRPHARSV